MTPGCGSLAAEALDGRATPRVGGGGRLGGRGRLGPAEQRRRPVPVLPALRARKHPGCARHAARRRRAHA